MPGAAGGPPAAALRGAGRRLGRGRRRGGAPGGAADHPRCGSEVAALLALRGSDRQGGRHPRGGD
ncbi:MAG: hypothetical protein D6798_11750, partial [Deltaproteobacteria bacterium]